MLILERAKGFEPSTPTLARLCSTPELRPRSKTGGDHTELLPHCKPLGLPRGARFEFRRPRRQYRRMAPLASRHRAAAAIAIALALSALASCGVRLRDASLLDRCGILLQEAFPGGDIKVTKQEAMTPPADSIAAIAVAVRGIRRNVAPGSIPLREVAAECRFDQGILTGFRWTQGPLR
jgi:hypothetical protein